MGRKKDKVEQLLGAIKLGNLKSVEEHLNNGVNVNARGGDGSTPLIAASEKGNVEIMNALIDKGANINKSSNDIWSSKRPLYSAIASGNVEAVKLLLEKNVSLPRAVTQPDGIDTYVDSPLYRARNKEKILDAVIEAYKKRKVSVYKLARKHLRVSSDLATISNIKVFDDLLQSPLTKAIKAGNEAEMNELLENGADINAKDGYGLTPLDTALSAGKDDIAKQLVKQGASLKGYKMNKLGYYEKKSKYHACVSIRSEIADQRDKNARQGLETKIGTETRKEAIESMQSRLDLLGRYENKSGLRFEELKALAKQHQKPSRKGKKSMVRKTLGKWASRILSRIKNSKVRDVTRAPS